MRRCGNHPFSIQNHALKDYTDAVTPARATFFFHSPTNNQTLFCFEKFQDTTKFNSLYILYAPKLCHPLLCVLPVIKTTFNSPLLKSFPLDKILQLELPENQLYKTTTTANNVIPSTRITQQIPRKPKQ